MGKIQWCTEKQAIKIINPNKNLSESFLARAEKDFFSLNKQDQHWKIVFQYYICYNAFMAVLLRYGIKSDVHSCTIELMSLIKEFSNHHNKILELKKKRINAQYSLKYEDLDAEFVKQFVSLCKIHIKKFVTKKRILELREQLTPKS